MITMIGSTAGGLRMVRDSTTSVKRFSMELGGNAPVIVTPSADLSAAAAHVIGNKMRCAGQTCVAPQRAFVHRSVYREFLAMCTEIASGAQCGTLDEQANTGPLIDEAAVARMEQLVEDAGREGGPCGVRRNPACGQNIRILFPAHHSYRGDAGDAGVPGGGLRPRAGPYVL